MRQGPNSRRSRGRGTNSGRRQNVPLRHQTFDSNGPDVRIRGNAYQVHEKYLALARDATSAGDRIAAENYYQHAEHYFRIITIINESAGSDGQHQRGGGPRPDMNGNGHFGAEGNGHAGDDSDADEDEGGRPPINA
jgi:hypothetical protein